MEVQNCSQALFILLKFCWRRPFQALYFIVLWKCLTETDHPSVFYVLFIQAHSLSNTTHRPCCWLQVLISVLLQISNQPVTWSKLSAFSRVDMVKRFKLSFRIGLKGDIREFERSTVVLVGFTENGLKKEKISSERRSCGWKCLVDASCQSRVVSLLRAVGKATETKITTPYDQGMQKSIMLNTEAGWVQQQKAALGATACTGSPKWDNRKSAVISGW